MPSYSPDESTCPHLGLSTSYLQESEKSRIGNNWECTLDRDFDSDAELSEGYCSGPEDESDEDCLIDGCMFHFESPKPKKVRTTKTPIWYDNEEPYHLTKIVNEYNRELKTFVEDNNICSRLKDCRRLPNFIGRIKRIPVESDQPLDEFTTLDKIDIFRRDVRPCGSTTTWIKSTFVLTSWDKDGMPDNFVTLSDEISDWKQRAIESIPITFIYCLPVWQSKIEFQYTVEKEKHDVGYANQPFNYGPFLPKHFLFNDDKDMDKDIDSCIR